MSDNGIYKPRGIVAIGSSFEGILNNGARECGLTTFNAEKRIPDGVEVYSSTPISARDFPSMANDYHVQGFLALRPLVEKAEDYHTVMELIRDETKRVKRLGD